ncbi:MAG: hypothetical protein LQ340_006782, partial [Diploschistes diacapsis]
MAPLPKSSLVYLDLHPPKKRSSTNLPSSPFELSRLLHARDAANTASYQPGSGAVAPTSISNSGILALFGLLGAGFVIASIWFFFWAKNGGFRWRKNDWSEYKSTVLRRKGPNGTTLSNATRSTKLGDGSIVGSQGSMSEFSDKKGGIRGGYLPTSNNNRGKKTTGATGDQKNRSHKKNKQDKDVRAYRHEKVAKVGGLNREAEGSYHEWTNTAPSVSDAGSHAPLQKPSRQAAEPTITHNKPSARQFSYTAGTESRFSVASDDSHRPLRASAQQPGCSRHSNTSSPRHSRQPSPTKGLHNNHAAAAHNSHGNHNRYSSRASVPGSYTEPLDFESRYDSQTEQSRNTKAYFHPIPGLSK